MRLISGRNISETAESDGNQADILLCLALSFHLDSLKVIRSVLGLILGQGAEWKNKSEKSLKEWEIQLVWTSEEEIHWKCLTIVGKI